MNREPAQPQLALETEAGKPAVLNPQRNKRARQRFEHQSASAGEAQLGQGAQTPAGPGGVQAEVRRLQARPASTTPLVGNAGTMACHKPRSQGWGLVPRAGNGSQGSKAK